MQIQGTIKVENREHDSTRGNKLVPTHPSALCLNITSSEKTFLTSHSP